MTRPAVCKPIQTPAAARPVFEHEGKVYTREDVQAAIRATGVNPGDSVFVHSNLQYFGKLSAGVDRAEYLSAFVQAIRDAVGPSGNILMPTFSYTFCNRQDFDPARAPSTVGVLTEFFRAQPGVKRSLDPIFSVAASGPDQDYFTAIGQDCFGKDSIFEKLYDRNATLVFIGETLDITYMHFVEQRFGVPYRFIKKFRGKIKIAGKFEECVFDYNVRKLNDTAGGYDFEKIAGSLRRRGVLRESPLGYSKVQSVGAVDAFNVLTEELETDVTFLIKSVSEDGSVSRPVQSVDGPEYCGAPRSV